MRIVQITDCHVGEPGELMADRVDAADRLRRTIRTINELTTSPDLVLATGDLVNDGRAGQYDVLLDLLATVEAPILPCVGNHDDRTELRRRFRDLPSGGADDPIDQVVEWDDVVLLGLDTIVPGRHGGHLGRDQLTRLDRRLTDAGDRPVIVFQHHPPFSCGVPWMDRYRLDEMSTERSILERHGNIVAVLAGHYHLPIQVTIGSAAAWSMTSTAALIDAESATTAYTSAPTGFGIHDLAADGTLSTRLVAVADAERWRPSWADDGDD